VKKDRRHNITTDFLLNYQAAALKNAEQLLEEATILLSHERYARAYFLAVASIEETGKAWLAFSARGRNLTNQGLKQKLKQIFEDHSQKISSSFTCWITASKNKEATARGAVDLMIHLKRGRELSIYVDASDAAEVLEPETVVRPAVALDAAKLALECLKHTVEHLSTQEPPTFNSFDDKLLCINTDKITRMINEPDFGTYLFDRIERQGRSFSFSEAVVTYHDAYFSRDRKFGVARP
jgi:AbiV family abortive infection protein